MRAVRKNDDFNPRMPPLTVSDHIVGYLFEIGPIVTTGMGTAPISHQEMQAWQHNVGIALEPWQARLIRQLSHDYIAEMQRAEKPDCPAPWGDLHKEVMAYAMRMQMRELRQL